ncbi:hypothetical protein LK494_04105 [Anaerovorax odorimutans]|nr:hypothetical protein [Anaerovorax odorimutans]
MNNNMSFNELWRKKVTRIGTIMIPIIMLSMFLPVIYLKVRYGVFPEWSIALSSWGTIAAAFGAYYIIEPLSYYPILGLSGTYMAFTSGSISDIRMPASAVAQEAVGVPYGSDEGAVVSTIGVAGSVFTTLVVVFITAVFGTSIIEIFPEKLLTAVKLYTVPAVFSAVYIQFCKFEPKLSFIIAITTVIFLLLAHIYGLMMITAVIIPVLLARLLYKKGFFGKKDGAEN